MKRKGTYKRVRIVVQSVEDAKAEWVKALHP